MELGNKIYCFLLILLTYIYKFKYVNLLQIKYEYINNFFIKYKNYSFYN